MLIRYRFIGEWFDEGDESLEVCKNVDPDQLEQQDQCVSALQAKANDVAGDINKVRGLECLIEAFALFSLSFSIRGLAPYRPLQSSQGFSQCRFSPSPRTCEPGGCSSALALMLREGGKDAGGLNRWN